jgi:hypothetical protein
MENKEQRIQENEEERNEAGSWSMTWRKGELVRTRYTEHIWLVARRSATSHERFQGTHEQNVQQQSYKKQDQDFENNKSTEYVELSILGIWQGQTVGDWVSKRQTGQHVFTGSDWASCKLIRYESAVHL